MINIVQEKSPHLLKKASVARMMIDVLIALIPVVVFSIVAFSWNAVMIISVSIAAMVVCEFVFVGLKNIMPFDGQKHSFKEKFKYAYSNYTINNLLSPLVSAIIFAMIIPSGVIWYVTLIGAVFGIVIGKLVFGGLGKNIFNPALVGMVIIKLSFPGQFSPTDGAFFDVGTGGTILSDINKVGFAALNNYSVLDLFLGKCPGTLGEISAICILVGGLYLFIRRSADMRAAFSFLGTFIVMMMLAGIVICNKYEINYWKLIGAEIFSGGLLFAAVFMVTDPVTSPINSPGRVIFGIIAGVCTVFIRLFGGLAEGVGFSILIANMFVPMIDYYRWSSQRFTKKKILLCALLVGIPTIIMILTLCFGGVL